ncbi:MAG TPA: recombinase family protein [Thermoanaerobaculia bacterium]|nr:recombinase family protein [Thermoanaerobaculia bacterium]
MRQRASSSRNGGEEGKRVGLFIRVSTEDQAKGESPEHHEARGRMYAESKGWTPVTVYDLAGVSGKSVMDHPEVKRMLADIKEGSISGLIFSKLARLARNTRELLEFAAIFEEHGADLISLQESIDTSTPAGRLFYTLIAAMAQWEREEIAERVAASVPIRAKLGKRIAGAGPYGYTWKDGKLVPDETEAPVRRLMYELFRETKRIRTVARLLNERGYRTRKGGLFTGQAVYQLLFDPTAKGVRRANYTTIRNGKKMLKPEHEWVYHSVPAIVSEELWHECTAYLTKRKEGMKPGRRGVHLFSGLTYCACGKKMYVVSDSPKYVCQKCRTKIPTGDLEAVFVEELKGMIFSPESVAEQLVGVDTEIAERTGLLEALRHEHGKLVLEGDKLYRLYLDGNITGKEFGERNQPLAVRREQLDREIPRLAGEIDFLTIRRLSSSEVLSEAQSLYSRWGDLSFKEKREIVETIVERVVVGKEDVEIHLAYMPPPPLSPRTPPTSPKDAAKRERTPRPLSQSRRPGAGGSDWRARRTLSSWSRSVSGPARGRRGRCR